MNGPDRLAPAISTDTRPAPRGRTRAGAVVLAAAVLAALAWAGIVMAGRTGRAEAEAPSVWTRGAIAAGGVTTALIVAMAAALVRAMRASERREALLACGQAALAAANDELSAARARADATAAGLEAAIASMSDGITIVDRDLRLVHWNEMAAEVAGVPRALLKPGASVPDILLHQARSGEFGDVDPEADVERRLGERWNDAVRQLRYERVRPDGRAIEVRRRRLPGGGFVTLFTDITARRQAEDALRSARVLAETASEAKSRFVATVSHEIRTPLNTLLNSLRMLLDETGMRPEQRRLALMAGQSGDALLALLNDVLEMSRMEAGRLALRPSPFALAPLMASVAEMFRAEAGGRGLSLHVRVGDEVPEIVTTDPGRVRQVLINLVSNAVKFSSPGAIWIRASCGSRDAGGPDGGSGELCLTVEDCGPPICEHDRGRLFLPFSQLDQRPPEGAAGGSGLGLSICQRLTALLGGRIGCETTAAGGNTFWVRLPVRAPGGGEALPPAPRISAGRPPRTRILLVDDVAPSRQVMAALLRRDGHAVDVADSGEAAVQAAAGRPYDVVLMDVFMPGMGGLAAARAIRSLPGAAGRIPIVALTADACETDRAALEAAGMQGAVVKPVEPEALSRALELHVWQGRQGPAEPAAPPEAQSASEVLSERRLASLRDHLSIRTLSSLVEDCLGEIDGRLRTLAAAVARRDMQGAHDEAHALSGLAGSYGMEQLDRRLREVMHAARAGDPAGAACAAERLSFDVEEAARALRKALASETV